MRIVQISQLSSPNSTGSDGWIQLSPDCLYASVGPDTSTTRLNGPDDGVVVLYGIA